MTAGRAGAVAALAAAAAGWFFAVRALWDTAIPDDLRTAHLDVGRVFTRAQLHRMEDFDRFAQIDFVVTQVTLVAVLALYAWRGARFARESAAGRIGTGMLLGMLGLAIVWLVQLPFGLAELWWARKHDVAQIGYLEWVLSSWLSLGLELLFVSFALAIVMALAGPLRNWWWTLGAPFFVGLSLLFAFVQPYAIPDTHRLRDPELVAIAQRLAQREGVEGTPVVVQDVRRYTTAPNAEAAGFGGSRKVVLWDTLLDGRFSDSEVAAVLAHEYAHVKHRDVLRSVGWFALLAIPGAALIALATRRRGGMRRPEAVPLGLFVMVVLQLAALPLQNLVTRRMEAAADWASLQATRDPRAEASMFRELALAARADPDPPTWAYVFIENHPTIAQRLAMVEAWRRRNAGR